MLRTFLLQIFSSMIFIYLSVQVVQAQTYRFEKTFGDDIIDGYKIVQLADSGFIFTSSSWTSTLVTHLIITRVDKVGNLIWSKRFDRDDNMMNVFALMNDGKFCVACVNCENFSSYINTSVILKIDTAGGVIWEKELSGFTSQAIWGIDKISSSKYVLAGSAYDGNDQDCYALSIDSGGNLLWSHRFGDTATEAFTDVQLTSDHNLMMVGTNGNYFAEKLRLVKMDSDGNLIFNHRFSWANSISAWSIQQTKNHDFIVAGNYITNLFPHLWYPALFRFDSTGNLKWWRYYLGDWKVAENFSSKETTDGGIVGLLEVESFPQDSDRLPMGLFKTDASGIPQWARLYLDTASFFPWDVIITSDHSFAVAGNSRSIEQNMFLIKTDFDGKTSCNNIDIPLQNFTDSYFALDSTGVIKSGGQLGNIVLQDSFITLPDSTHCSDFDFVTGNPSGPATDDDKLFHPNPFSDATSIDLPSLSSNSVHHFVLLNSLGKIVLQKDFTSEELILERSGLPSGIYFYRISLNSTSVNSGSLIIQ